MQTLIKKIAAQADIDESKAMMALLAVCNHMKEEFPSLEVYADAMLGAKEKSVINETYVITNIKKETVSGC